MYCPECKSENSDSAKFCKKCGKPLKDNVISHQKMINDMNNQSSGSDTTKIIIISLIVIAVVLAGAFIYIYGLNNDNSSQDDASYSGSGASDVDEPEQASQPTESSSSSSSAPQSTSSSAPQTTSSMSIISGSFSTGSSLSDKTYASIYVGSQHAGENVKVQIFYSRDGVDLNNGNMVPKTVDSSGYIDVASAEAYEYYPDFAVINLYDTNGNLLDTLSVSLTPDSGTQFF